MSKKSSSSNIALIAAVSVGILAVPLVIRYMRRRRFLSHLAEEEARYGAGYNDDINFDDGRRPLFNQYQERKIIGRYRLGGK